MTAVIENAIKKGIEDVNSQQESGSQFLDDENQVLIGEGGILDSLGILVFITAVESCLRPDMPNINLVDLLMTPENAIHFESIGALKRYLYSIA